jgi:hypothetical protein
MRIPSYGKLKFDELRSGPHRVQAGRAPLTLDEILRLHGAPIHAGPPGGRSCGSVTTGHSLPIGARPEDSTA